LDGGLSAKEKRSPFQAIALGVSVGRELMEINISGA